MIDTKALRENNYILRNTDKAASLQSFKSFGSEQFKLTTTYHTKK